MSEHHPFVSEAHEGRPWFEWAVALCVVASAVLGLAGHLMAATFLMAGVSVVTAVVRLVWRDRSPWKIRSVAFDAFIGLSLGAGLVATYLTVPMM